jgi:HSP20 family molecular chaperone IbpA
MMTTWSAVPTLDRIFDETLRSPFRSRSARATFPVAGDISEKNGEYTFQLDVPGVKREDIEITLDNHVLAIHGVRRFEPGKNEKVTLGRPYGSFAVSYALPEGIEGASLTAELADGVLTVRVPKQPSAQPRRIPIGGGADISGNNRRTRAWGSGTTRGAPSPIALESRARLGDIVVGIGESAGCNYDAFYNALDAHHS